MRAILVRHFVDKKLHYFSNFFHNFLSLLKFQQSIRIELFEFRILKKMSQTMGHMSVLCTSFCRQRVIVFFSEFCTPFAPPQLSIKIFER